MINMIAKIILDSAAGLSSRASNNSPSNAFGADGSVRDTCERHGIGSGQIYTWRRQAMSGELTGLKPATLPAFAEVEVAPPPAALPPTAPLPPSPLRAMGAAPAAPPVLMLPATLGTAKQVVDDMDRDEEPLVHQLNEERPPLSDEEGDQFPRDRRQLLSQLSRFQFAFAARVGHPQPVQLCGQRRGVCGADTGQREKRLTREIEFFRRGEIATMAAFV